MIAEILKVTDARGSHRVVYRFVEGNLIVGPFVENRPSAEDHQAWATSMIRVEVDENANLGVILGADADSFRTALANEGVESIILDDRGIRVTAPKTTPRTLQSGLVERLGLTAVNRIRTKLRNAGFGTLAAQYGFDKLTI